MPDPIPRQRREFTTWLDPLPEPEPIDWPQVFWAIAIVAGGVLSIWVLVVE